MTYNTQQKRNEVPKGYSNIKGKMYKNVILRVNEFRTSENFAGFGIDTSIKDFGFDSGFVVVEAKIFDTSGRIVGSGLAEEKRGSSNINKFSALENCETSAIGRALSSIGLGGEEYCSAEELLLAISKQDEHKNVSKIGPVGKQVLKSLNVEPEKISVPKEPTKAKVTIVPSPKDDFKKAYNSASKFLNQKNILSICKVSLKKDTDGKFSVGLNQLSQLDDMQLRRCTSDLNKKEAEHKDYLETEFKKATKGI